MKIFLILFAFAILSGCGSSIDNLEENTDAVIKSESGDHGITDGAILITRDQLTGTWTDGKTPSPAFDIGLDSMYYYDAMETYPYQLTGDTIKIFFAEETLNGKVWLEDDTLIISDPAFSTTKYYRVKK